MSRRLLVVSTLLFAGCTDFPTPAELTKPTILAIVAEPPLVAPGETTELSVVLAGPDGPMTASAVDWALIENLPGLPPFGALEPLGDGRAIYTAPDPLPDLPDNAPPATSVAVAVTAGETRIEAVKIVVVADIPAVNPRITALAVGPEVVPAGGAVTLAAGQPYYLDVGVAPPPGEDAAFAWYSTVGEIERYQSNPCELVASPDPDTGWLFVVIRDGRGGVTWRAVEATVE